MQSSRVREQGGIAGRGRGFVLVCVLALSAAALALLSLALASLGENFEENAAIARRLRIENVSAQAAAAAVAWFEANAASIAPAGGFDPGAEPEGDPTPDVPESIFAALRGEYPEYSIECRCFDLHYPDSFEEQAQAARLPKITPFETEEGGTARAYALRVVVTEKKNSKAARATTASMRIKKSGAGLITAHAAAVTE